MARVVVTRPAGQEVELVERLQLLGHEVTHVPLIEIVPSGDDPVDVDGYDWVVVTSVNGARELLRRKRGTFARVAAIGRATAEALGGADLVPRTSTQEGLLAELPWPAGRVLFAGADGARPLLAQALDADVAVLYRTLALVPPQPVNADLVVLASASAASALAASPSPHPPAVSIGPETSKAARERGLEVLAEAVTHDLEGLIAAVEQGADESDARRFRPPHPSPRLERAAGDPQQAAALRAELEGRAPLIEEIAGDPGHRLVTVVAEGPGAVSWAGGLAGADSGTALEPLPGTGLLVRSLRLPADASTLYWLARENGPLEADRLAPERYTIHLASGGLEASLLRLPSVRAFLRPESPSAGRVERRRFRSSLLGNERDVYLYLPAPAPGPPALLVLLDGMHYAGDLGAPGTLDRLIREVKLPPVAAVFPDALDQDTRARELACNETHARHLADELLPWAREVTGATEEPSRTVVGGLSFGGLAAVYAAQLLPEVFGAAISQSGAFHWNDESLTRLIRDYGRAPARISLEVGILDGRGDFRILPDASTLLAANRRLRAALERLGGEVRYVEFPGGHDSHWWAALLPETLAWAFRGSPAG